MSYSPTLGRFLQQDPLGYVDGMNLYQMEGSNPVNRVDPLGTDSYPNMKFPGNTDVFWRDWTAPQRTDWFASFEANYGHMIDRSAWNAGVPRELLAAVVANEMIDFRWNDRHEIGTSVGPAQLTYNTLQNEGLVPPWKPVGENIDISEPHANIMLAGLLMKKYLDRLADAGCEGKLSKDFLNLYGVPISDKDWLAATITEPTPLKDVHQTVVNRDVSPALISRMALMWNNGPQIMFNNDIFHNAPNGYSNGAGGLRIGNVFDPIPSRRITSLP